MGPPKRVEFTLSAVGSHYRILGKVMSWSLIYVIDHSGSVESEPESERAGGRHQARQGTATPCQQRLWNQHHRDKHDFRWMARFRESCSSSKTFLDCYFSKFKNMLTYIFVAKRPKLA